MSSSSESWEALHSKLRREVPWGYAKAEEAFPDFLAAFLPEEVGPVLDIGCGNGRNAAFASAQGFSIVGVDFAPSALDMAAERLPDGRFVLAQIPPFPFQDREFKLAWDIGCLHALPPQLWPEYARELARIVAPRGQVYIHVRHRDKAHEQQKPVIEIKGVPEWGVNEEDLDALFTGFSVRRVTPHEGRPPERFLRIFLERDS